jgi:hypothetical protein
MAGRTLLLAVLAAGLLTACGGDDDPLVTGTTTTSEATTTTASTTTTVATTTTAPPACPAVEPVAGASDVVEYPADVDGDGAPDRVRTERTDPAAEEWLLTVELAAGGGSQEEIPGDGIAAVTIIGGHDLDGDGADELWVRVGAGAYATILGLFRLDGCDLERLTDVPIGSSLGSAIGAECGGTVPGAVLTTYGGNRDPADDLAFEITTTEYALEGDELVAVREETTSVPADDPDFQRYISFRCGDLDMSAG